MVLHIKRRKGCKVCNSPKRWYYEKLYFESGENISSREMVKEALKEGEMISHNSFWTHFKEDYDRTVIEAKIKESKLDEPVAQEEEEKSETINIIEGIAENLKGLKDLIEETKNFERKTPGVITAIANLYEKHSVLLEKLEKIKSDLSIKTGMSLAEMYKLLFQISIKLCPECREKLWADLDDRFKESD